MKKFVKITQVKVTGNRYEMNIGASPSGKATDSDSVIRVFESLRPSHEKHHPVGWCFSCGVVKNKGSRDNGGSCAEREKRSLILI